MMKTAIRYIILLTVITGSGVFFSSFNHNTPPPAPFVFPYKQAGLTERQAAAYLLNRFTYGAMPGEVDEVVNMGLENWFQQQLKGDLPDDSLKQRLSIYDAITLSNTEVVNTYPRPGQVLKMAVAEGIIKKDTLDKADKQAYRKLLLAYMQQKGIKPQQELFRQFVNQKILRAAYSHNQLQEVLTDFWFNHFNVSMTKNDCAAFIPAYERDVIRPNVTGSFEGLLMATAKSPAMLLYLDNFSSAGTDSAADNQTPGMMLLRKRFAAQMQSKGDTAQGQLAEKVQKLRKAQGLNENYAREVMELHTLGVDGGYTQQDVTQAARILTGWTVYPMDNKGYGNAMKKLIERVGEDRLTKNGFVHEGDFMFAANRHDNKAKTVLGRYFAPGGGYQEGVQLLQMLAHHPSTAAMITKKIAVRFVSDNPPPGLLAKMQKTFLEKNGSISQVLITMAASPEFWTAAAMREKTKSPFELAISAVRSLHADIRQPYPLYTWISRMGQKMYFYQAPTGFPDKGQYWINTGSLLNRMNFGLALAAQRIPGTTIDLIGLNNHHEPESAASALLIYSKLLMPERNLEETIRRLTPLLNDPELVQRIDQAAAVNKPPQPVNPVSGDDAIMMDEDKQTMAVRERKNFPEAPKAGYSMLSQVAGIVIGSPEFQRR